MCMYGKNRNKAGAVTPAFVVYTRISQSFTHINLTLLMKDFGD